MSSIREIVKQFLPEDPVILEAGAHIGRDTVKLVKTWPLARIYAFEPVPDLFAQLKQKTDPINQISCYQLALSNTIGSRELFVSSGRSDAASSLLKPKNYLADNPEVLFDQTVLVSTTTIDEWAKSVGISRLDFLWLDMQGAELQVLQAAPEILKTVKALYTEVNLTERYERNPLFSELQCWLEAQDFSLHHVSLHKKNWGNALFIRNNV